MTASRNRNYVRINSLSAGCRSGVPQHGYYIVERLPAEIRRKVDTWLVEHSFGNRVALMRMLRSEGIEIGKSALAGYAQRFRDKVESERTTSMVLGLALLNILARG